MSDSMYYCLARNMALNDPGVIGNQARVAIRQRVQVLLGSHVNQSPEITYARKRINCCYCLNYTLDGATLFPTMRKPFDALAEGLSVS